MTSIITHIFSLSSLLIILFASIVFVQDMQLLSVMNTSRFLCMEISHRIASDISNLVNIALTTGSNNMIMVKELNIPSNILGRSFIVSLKVYGGFYYVEVGIIDWKWVNSSSIIPLKASSDKVVFEFESGILHFRDKTIYYSSSFLGGVKNLVIWVFKDNQLVKIGLGVMKN
ncbi:MAG: hypothetical protein QXO82_04890 [Candidatus Methanomethylicia archaeon]